MDHLRPTLCYNRVMIFAPWQLKFTAKFALFWNNFWVIQTNNRMGQVSNTFMVVFLWLGNLKWNFKKIFFINISKCHGMFLIPMTSWNLCTKSFLKYFFLANLVIKSLLYLCLIIILFGYLVCLPKTNFRKVEFNCKVQLSRWPLLYVPFALRVPYVWQKSSEIWKWVYFKKWA